MNAFRSHQSSLPVENNAGMTLVELIVATAISSILVLLAVTTLGSSTEVWKDSRATAEALSDGRAVTLMMRRDFANRLRDTPVFVEPSVASLAGLRSNLVAFYTTSTGMTNGQDVDHGDVGLVVYYTAFTPDHSGGRSPKLFRAWLSPKEVWEIVESHGWDLRYRPDPMADAASGRAEIIAPNVLQFVVAELVQDDSGSMVPATDVNMTDDVRIEGMDMVLRVVESDVAARLKTEGDWSGATTVANRLFDDDAESDDDAGVRTFRVRF